jgi:hypothetical protein
MVFCFTTPKNNGARQLWIGTSEAMSQNKSSNTLFSQVFRPSHEK